MPLFPIPIFFWTSGLLDVPAGVTQEKIHTEFLIHLPFAVIALIFLARRIQPFLSLVDRDFEFFVLTIQSFSTCWAFFLFCTQYFLVRKIPSYYRDSNSRPTCQMVSRLPTELPGRPYYVPLPFFFYGEYVVRFPRDHKLGFDISLLLLRFKSFNQYTSHES